MKRASCVLVVVTLLAGLSGCVQGRMYSPRRTQGITGLLPGSCMARPNGCRSSNMVDPGRLRGGGALLGRQQQQPFAPGPPTAAVTYPYYTVRGPRDFLAAEPRPVGP